MTLTKTRLLLFALSSGFLLLSCNHEDEYVPKSRIIKVSIEGTTESKFQVTRILKKILWLFQNMRKLIDLTMIEGSVLRHSVKIRIIY